MVRKLLLSVSLALGLLMVLAVSTREGRPVAQAPAPVPLEPPVEMPPLLNDQFAHLAHYGGVPQEQRDEMYRKWIAAGVKISVSGASGSGTIVYFDSRDGYAYVQSCGHLWNGKMTAEQGKQKKLTCKIITWYHNEKKLDSPKEYPAEVLYYNNPNPDDISLMRFKPDWVPNYIPIGPPDLKLPGDARLHSVGCDGGREIAHYEVRFVSYSGTDIVTTENSPRRGRSGGGLMTEDYYVGVCSRSSDPDGTIGKGNGYFTGLESIRKMNEKNGYGWLNDVGINWARQIPIIDRNGPQKKHPKDYIPLPTEKP